ncbi:MAG: redox-sensing transcriptional repressor Rex [Planctomycetota bacterium]
MSKAIPRSVIRRLPDYLAQVERLAEAGVEWVSSQEIADALELTSSTVRQDLSHMEVTGTSKRGYETEKLEALFAQVLGAGKTYGVALMGAGNLGKALALHGDFKRRGFNITAIYDQNPALHGKRIGEVAIQSPDALRSDVRTKELKLGIIAVPAHAAQEVADQLVTCGLRGILNLAQAHIITPSHVPVINARIIASLQRLVYAVNEIGSL